jgi:hypothetical protein
MMDKDRGRGVCEEKVILELIFLEDKRRDFLRKYSYLVA